MDSTHAGTESEKKPRKILWWLIYIVVAVAILVSLFYGEEDLQGGLAWAKFKGAQEKNGERFSLADFIPPPVPDDENFAMTPLLRPALDYVQTGDSTRWRDTNAWAHLMSIRIDLGANSDRNNLPDVGDAGQGPLRDLAVFASFYRGNTNYPQSDTRGNAAEDVLTALSKFDPDLKELQDADATRPSSRFPIDYHHEPSSDILLPHLACVKSLSMVCELRAVAELETHRNEEAFADLQTSLRLVDSIRDEPFLIDHLVRIAGLNISLQGIREGLARRAWTDTQLVEFETNLANIDLLREYKHTMRSERCLNIGGLDYMRRKGVKDNPLADYASNSRKGSGIAFNWMPGGWYRQNMVLIGEYYRDYILPSVDESNRLVSTKLGGAMTRDLAKRRMTPQNIFAKLIIPGFANSSQRTARGQTSVDEAQVACALERYRMAHDGLPNTLDALTPEFIPKIPNDLFDGQPLRYKKNMDGTYLIYSIGWNQKDEGGMVALRKGSTPRADPNRGDWVWQNSPQ
jgi:hypothetical protein